MEIHINNTNELDSAAADIIKYAADNRLFLFYGEMGAGKTTLIKSLCAAVGVHDAVTSPTFSIVNEYEGASGPVFHFDFYRLKDQSEAMDMGYEEYFYSGNYCFVEWPEKIASLVPNRYTGIRIQLQDNGGRQITVENI
ncbi:tRNA (adenosine(37)-N6)-threonylcarbamoyltransferase complex ATPase subunit type 1 TsaE [Mucilaginibacter pallidiroseus]|uniref:tRNA threonylcarbamoyladenosine biosynthesis protein TsaE n=1 Tax=Mucilaginibacter pallidiroseus TaxID=2599295 RepID=A0A563UH05_9SPHI|nr:tRNA (adenosine(37)-N6)-threonylcarbamoyltransferase complex ATPase subunit type 1 TsaE [Mucilaginibacter pallidiroseus]TWR30586.1 tRNA (adenosine(37)-N6)-threonylcarbamoyltransferase complex ATPase subunit type 1 TsaE [Mucilaginibacter pallidiroseus]